MLPESAPPIDWLTFGQDRPQGTLVVFDGRSLSVSGRSAFGMDSLCETPHWTAYFDGLLYNHDELRRQLTSADAQDPPSYAELLGLAYERWGLDVAQHLQGVFSLVLWDKLSGTLLATRDCAGIFPLFYASQDGIWYLSTSLDLLTESLPIGATLNRSLFVSWIAFVWPVHDETPYNEIRRVRNGYQLIVTETGDRIERYWDIVERIESQGWVTENEVGRLDELMQQALDRFLSIGEAALYLSGGLDSVSVAVYAADGSKVRHMRPPLAMSVEFPSQDPGESRVQRDIATQLRMPQYFLPMHTLLSSRGVVPESLELCASFPEPSLNLWRPIYTRLGTRAVAEGRRVLLTGGGGDEWLGVTPTYAADLMMQGDLTGLRNILSAYNRSFSLSTPATLRNVLWSFGLRPLLGNIAAKRAATIAPNWLRDRQMRHWRSKFQPWLAVDPDLQEAIDQRLALMLDDAQRTRWSLSPYMQELAEGMDHIVVAMDMENLFDEGRRLGAPILSPFQDSEVVEFLARTPPELLNTGGRAKGLVRGKLADRFPDQGFERQKKSTLGDFFENTLFPGAYAAWGEMDGAQALAELGVVDSHVLNPAIDDLRNGRHSLVEQWHMLYVVYLEQWVRHALARM